MGTAVDLNSLASMLGTAPRNPVPKKKPPSAESFFGLPSGVSTSTASSTADIPRSSPAVAVSAPIEEDIQEISGGSGTIGTTKEGQGIPNGGIGNFGNTEMMPVKMVFHGAFPQGFHMCERVPVGCTLQYLAIYLEWVLQGGAVGGGAKLTRLYNKNNYAESFDITDNSTSIAKMFDLSNELHFAVEFDNQPVSIPEQEIEMMPANLLFHGDFPGGYHMVDSCPKACTIAYLVSYLENFVGGTKIKSMYNYHDIYESYDITDARTAISTMFDLSNRVEFSVTFEGKPKMAQAEAKPAAKPTGHAEKACKGIFGTVKKVVNEMDGTYQPEEGATVLELRAAGNAFFTSKRCKDAAAAYSAAIGRIMDEVGEGVMGTANEQRARQRIDITLRKIHQDEQAFATKIMGQLQQAEEQLAQARKDGGEAKYQETLASMGGDPHSRAQEMIKPKDSEKNAVVMAARSNMTAVRREAMAVYNERHRVGRFTQISTLLSNRAAAYLELREYKKAVEDARAALQWDYSNLKAAYRLGVGLRDLGELQEAAQTCTYVKDFAREQGRGKAVELDRLVVDLAKKLESCARQRVERVEAHQLHVCGDQIKDPERLLQAFLSIPKFLMKDLQRPANVVKTPPHEKGEVEYEWLVKAVIKETPLDFGTLRAMPEDDKEVVQMMDSSIGGYVTQAFTDWTNKVRMPMCCHFAFAVPNTSVLTAIAEFSEGKLVEIGSGSGYWAKLLKVRHAVDCVCYDLDATDQSASVLGTGTKLHHVRHHHTVQGGANCAGMHKDRCLFLCWPPKDDPMAYDALTSYMGDSVVYVGEWEPDVGGRAEYPPLDHDPAAADRRFREKLMEDYERVGRVLLTNWPTFHDDCTFWKRRRERPAAVANRVEPTNKDPRVEMKKSIDNYIPGVNAAPMFDPSGRKR